MPLEINNNSKKKLLENNNQASKTKANKYA
jgi:hypothetical protein